MKIGLLQTYWCDKCQRYLHVHDLEIDYRDPYRYFSDDGPAHYFVVYACMCPIQRRMERVEHVIHNGELFPHYAPMTMK